MIDAGISNRRSVIHTYSAQFTAKHRGWIARLGNVSSNGAGDEPSEFSEPPENETAPPEEPPNFSEPKREEGMEPETPKVGGNGSKMGAAPKPSEGRLSAAAKAITAAAVPVCIALLLWASTGTLDETELSVGIAGLLTAMLVYFVPNEGAG